MLLNSDKFSQIFMVWLKHPQPVYRFREFMPNEERNERSDGNVV